MQEWGEKGTEQGFAWFSLPRLQSIIDVSQGKARAETEAETIRNAAYQLATRVLFSYLSLSTFLKNSLRALWIIFWSYSVLAPTFPKLNSPVLYLPSYVSSVFKAIESKFTSYVHLSMCLSTGVWPTHQWSHHQRKLILALHKASNYQ